MRSPTRPELFENINPTPAEKATPRAGDDIIAHPDVVMDRAFTLDASCEAVWPWLVQLGKHRAGWYLPSRLERFLPASRRAIRTIDPAWQGLRVGDVIPDYGGPHETFRVEQIEPPTRLVYSSRRGRTDLTWSITLERAATAEGATGARVFLRLRMAPVRRKWLAMTVGELFDLLTVAGLAAGLRERL